MSLFRVINSPTIKRAREAFRNFFVLFLGSQLKMWLWPIRGWLAKARLSPERDLNAEESRTNEPDEQTSVFKRTSCSCRARGSNPGPPDIVILQWPLHYLHTAWEVEFYWLYSLPVAECELQKHIRPDSLFSLGKGWIVRLSTTGGSYQ